jgi:RNA polymerase-associated protein CTR9
MSQSTVTPLILVLQSLVDFGKGNFQDCLKHLKQVINMNPRSPPSIWLGIGLCYYRLGNITKAMFTFQRVLDYEPGNVLANNAIVIIANMGDNILRDEDQKQKNATNLSRSYQTDKNNPLTLKLVAEHFFQMGQYDKAQSACE